MRETMRKYLENEFPNLGISSIYSQFSLRFELGAGFPNGSKERVRQVLDRSTEILKQTKSSSEVVLIIEEYPGEFYDPKGTNKAHLFSVVSEDNFTRINGPFDQTYYETDSSGQEIAKIADEKLNCDLLIGRPRLSESQISEILEGQANLEMGFEPCIPQDVTFFFPDNLSAFHMYDDRGCDIWANEKETLRPIYHSLNKWILDHNRLEIDQIFK